MILVAFDSNQAKSPHLRNSSKLQMQFLTRSMLLLLFGFAALTEALPTGNTRALVRRKNADFIPTAQGMDSPDDNTR